MNSAQVSETYIRTMHPCWHSTRQSIIPWMSPDNMAVAGQTVLNTSFILMDPVCQTCTCAGKWKVRQTLLSTLPSNPSVLLAPFWSQTELPLPLQYSQRTSCIHWTHRSSKHRKHRWLLYHIPKGNASLNKCFEHPGITNIEYSILWTSVKRWELHQITQTTNHDHWSYPAPQ